MQKILKYIFISLFFFLISFQLVLRFFDFHITPADTFENRALATQPNLTRQNYLHWPTLLDSYFKDSTPLRSQFIAAYIRLWACGMNAHRSIFFSGKDGEKFCDFNDAPTIKKYIGMFPMSQRTLIWLKLSYAGMQAYFSLHGIPYLVMFIPDKTTLYPEWLPEWINWARTKSHYEQIVPILANNRINFFDFLPVLQRHKNELRLYDQRYDIGHWNGNALDIAYQEAGKILNRYGIPVDQAQLKQAYAVKNVDLHFFCIGDEKVPMVEYTPNSDVVNVSDDLASLQHLPEQYKPQLFVNKKVSDHTLWVASDSYFAATHGSSRLPLPPFVHQYIHLRQLNLAVARKLLPAYKPDLVIEEFVERMDGAVSRANDPEIRILGDALLGTPGHSLVPAVVKRAAAFRDCTIRPEGESCVVQVTGKMPLIKLPPVETDDDGRAVLMAKMQSPEKTNAKVYYYPIGDRFSSGKVVSSPVIKGENFVHIDIYLQPHIKINVYFSPGSQGGDYRFLPMPDVERIKGGQHGF